MTEDQLRDQLRRVDDLTPPPAPDFAARAMRAAGRGAERRRTWGKGLLGVAAAIVIGTFAVMNLPRPSTSASSAAGVAVPGASMPEAATDGTTRATPKDTMGSVPFAPTAAATPTGPAPHYSVAECTRTLTSVRAAIPAFRQQGLPIIGAACDARGVVVVRMGAALTPEQRGLLTARYGARVSVAGRDGTPLP